MNLPGTFTLGPGDGRARTGRLTTAHGEIETPVFMPVGTQGTVKSLCPDDLRTIGAQIILGNTYHLYLRPGDELVAKMGGLHRFMAWDGPILTDSGGFQVFSLSGLRRITEEGVTFSSHIDGSKHLFSPEKVISIERNLGSDIMMVLDECVPYGADRAYTEKSLGLTTRWATRCRAAHAPLDRGQLLFGIVQGGFFKDLRAESARQLIDLDFEGYALGGLSVGESRAEMYDILFDAAPLLPADKPRYLMGVGAPRDLLAGMAAGIDMFDCVLPTRNARNGTLFTFQGKVNIKRAEYREDDTPLEADCPCYACRTFSKAYLRHLYVARELLSYRLNTLHNLTFFSRFMAQARQAIRQGRFDAFRSAMEAAYPETDA
ncbi:tRNA guanosine(34) transglycosylase Tgt [Solidesulfovibrio sp. C21]|uniref:tRNA guanosine(34) transglycosylase Tgt n=1 Tax=Solidesulfovibrio sp. C21 TaxID=3398613 RepID=UPI0039FDC8A8